MAARLELTAVPESDEVQDYDSGTFYRTLDDLDAARKEAQREADRKRQEAQKRQEDLNFERSVYVAVLTEKDFHDLLGAEWKSRGPKEVDLSDSRYKLETLEGPYGGLLSPALKKKSLNYIDISDNRLHDINCLSKSNGFGGVTTLLAKRNLLASVSLNLPKLVALNLSHNQLKQLPPLEKMPLLEVLMLSHNQLSGSIEGLKASAGIKRLDLSHNQFDFNPSQLEKALEHMGRLRGLHELRLFHNPFVACFKEYQVFLVKSLPSLRILDDLDITKYHELIRYDIKDAHILDLPVYDEAYRKRKEVERNEQQDRKMEDHSAAALSGQGDLPRLKDIMTLLEEIIDDVQLLQRNVARVQDIARRRAQHLKALNQLGDVFWEDLIYDEYGKVKPRAKATDLEYEAAVSRTLELIVLVMERHDSVRTSLIETLGWLTSVVKYAFGYKCLQRLGRIMTSSEEDKENVLHTLQSVVVPSLKSLALDIEGLNGRRTKELILAVVLLLDRPEHRADVARVLQDVIPMFLTWLESTVKAQDIQDGEHIIHALARLTDHEENCRLVASISVARKCVAAVNNQSYALGEKFCGLWLDFLHLAENLIRYSETDDVPKEFQTNSVHVTVISRGRTILGEGHIDEQTQKAKMISRILRFVACMMARTEQVLLDCCKSYHFTVYLCQLLGDAGDPLVLAEGCRCLLVILNHPQMYAQQGKLVIDDLMKLTPFLMFLGAERYAEIYSCAVHHDRGGNMVNVEPPPLAHLDDPLVCDAFVAIIKLFAYFAHEENGTDDLRDAVNTELDKQGRDQRLLRLLVVQNDAVRLAVMECMSAVAPEDIASEEMGMLVKCLSDTRNISEGETETVLALAMGLLEKLVESNGNEGVRFRANYAELAIAESFLILYQNALRNTYGQENEENQKLVLSHSIISFMRACSRRIPLRGYLRGPNIVEKFAEILKLEEDLHRPYARDVALEQTWTGRSVDILIKCLQDTHALHRHKRVLFRVLSRIADVMEGCPDFMDNKKQPHTLQELAYQECQMWNNKSILQKNLHLDEQELEDLQNEASDVRGRLDSILRHLVSFVEKIQEKNNMEILRTEAQWFAEAKMVGEQRMLAVASEKRQLVEAQDGGQQRPPEPKDVDVPVELSGDQVLVSAIHQFEDTVEDDSDNLFTLRPGEFVKSEEILLGMDGKVLPQSATYTTEYTINRAYMVCAFLRIVHAVLLVPPTEECRKAVINDFRKQEFVARLCSLVEGVPYLSCNVAAKFLAVMRLVLDAGTSTRYCPSLECMSLMSKYAQRIADGLLSLLKLTKDRCLDVREQTLCAALASFMMIIIRNVPVSVNWFGCPITRKETVAKCVDHLAPSVIIRLLIAIIIYDLQMDLGGGERARIQMQFVQQAYDKVAMKDAATLALVHFLVRCPHHKYNVLEVFSVADVFNQQSVRPCYLAELLNDVILHDYQCFVEDWLRSLRTPDLRVLKLNRVEVADPNDGLAVVQALLAATTESLYLLAPPNKQPLYAHGDELTGRWRPSWEAVFPREPTQVWNRQYSEIACLHKCYGSQIMAIEWKRGDQLVAAEAGKQPRSAAPTSQGRAGASCGIGATSGKAGGGAKQAADDATADRSDVCVLIFQRANARHDWAALLRKLSGNKVEHRARIVNDPSIRREVLEHPQVNDPTGDSVLAASVALSEPKTSMLDWGTKGNKEPQLFVLTLKKVLVFNVNLTAWYPQRLDFEEDIDIEDFRPKDLFPDTEAPPACGVVETKAPAAQLHPRASQKIQRTNVLKYINHYDLPPKEVIFQTRAEADLVIRFKDGSVVDIRFFDDTEREHWRRALAYTLFKTTQKVWTRDIPVMT